MGHDHHFLSRLDRVSSSHAELALQLYRDPDFLRIVLAAAKVPENIERVAISLNHHERGPFVLVSRAGRFITCLGEGMFLGDRFVIPRSKVDAVSQHIEISRSRIETAEKLGGPEEANNLLGRFCNAGDGLSSEEVHAVLLWKYLVSDRVHEAIQKGNKALVTFMRQLVRAKHPDKIDDETLSVFWQVIWAQGNLMALGGLELPDGIPDPVIVKPGELDPRVDYSGLGIKYAMSTTAFRGIWASATVGERLLDHYEQRIRTAATSVDITHILLSLLATGARHPETIGRIRKILKAPSAPNHRCPEDRDKIVSHVAVGILHCFDHARDVQATYDQEALDYVRQAPELAPLRQVRGNDLPVELARRLYFQQPFGIITWENMERALLIATWVARQRVEELFLPQEVLQILRPRWTREKSLRLVDFIRDSYTKSKPKRAAPTPGVNDPCSCGSGKKYKKCCLNGRLAN